MWAWKFYHDDLPVPKWTRRNSRKTLKMSKNAPHYSAEAVKKALESNRKLQDALKNEISVIQEKKRRNRWQAAACLRQLSDDSVIIKAHPASSRPVPRKTLRHFFVDQKQRPKPNADAKRRQDDAFFHHRRPPWHAKEVKRLQAALAVEASDNTANDTEFYQRVQQTFVKGCSSKGAVQRTAEECRVQHQRMQEIPLSENELEQMSAIVASSTASVDWIAVAATLSENRSQPCTPFQCLAAHHQQKAAPAPSWTLEEDTILFKFLAAAGPQLVLDFRHPLMQTLQRLLPNKSKSKIIFHATQSLLNPNLRHGDWTNTEERALAIYMKIYHKEDVAVVAASSHLQRNQKSVGDKWHRSMNPAYSTKPFTATEDGRLMEAIRSNPTYGWTDLSTEFFPNRHPHRLASRFSELATDQDILDREAVMGNKRRKTVTIGATTTSSI